VAYGIALATRPDDALAPFRNSTFWPAREYVTVAQDGLALPIFGHLMITIVGGTFLGAALVGLLVLVKKLGGPDLSRYVGLKFYAFLFVYSFLVVRAMPGRVTTIDPEAKTLEIRAFAPFTFIPGYHEVIRGADLTTMGLKIGQYHPRKDSDIVVRLYVSRREGEVILIGLRVCPSASDKPGCLAAGEEGAAFLAKQLGRELGAAETSASGTTRAFVLH
jgi:hypothetical protein